MTPPLHYSTHLCDPFPNQSALLFSVPELLSWPPNWPHWSNSSSFNQSILCFSITGTSWHGGHDVQKYSTAHNCLWDKIGHLCVVANNSCYSQTPFHLLFIKKSFVEHPHAFVTMLFFLECPLVASPSLLLMCLKPIFP